MATTAAVPLADRVAALGEPLGVDVLSLLTARSGEGDVHPQGRTSWNGASTLLPAADGWVAVSLARPDDAVMLPAWLGAGVDDDWAGAVAARSAVEVARAGRDLGLPVAALGEVHGDGDPVVRHRLGAAAPLPGSPLVVDLSSLWAGPLCAHLLHSRGARVVTVESRQRPDGARLGSPDFYDDLHAGHESVLLDFTSPRDLERLRSLLLDADVVIEASRPRALAQLGFDAADIVAAGPQVWLSITGYGRTGAAAQHVAFGDDAAVAGGLVHWADDGTPQFAGDAIADPLTGVVAATAVADALAAGGRWLLDVALARVAASVAP